MKNLQKFILPALILAIVAILYFTYFAPSDELGDFSRLDPNNSASVPVIVKYVKEKNIQRNADGTYTFFVIDKNNKEVMVNGLETIPPGLENAKSIVINGHMSGKDSFHAHGVELRN